MLRNPDNLSPSNSPDSDDANDFVVVGIGTSAGGLSALEEFCQYLPAEIEAAFVVIQHLSPQFKSVMKELLERKTRLPVYEIAAGMTLEPGSIYVMPGKINVTLEQGKFCLTKTEADSANLPIGPIDLCLNSIAKEYSNRAIAVLLSGTGSDGTEGLKAVSRAGGLAMIQSPETAEFSAMSQNAVPTGLVDEILSPQELAQTIAEIVRIASTIPLPNPVAVNIEPSELNKIIRILNIQEETDFSQYKIGTLTRRIYHRCSLTNHASIPDYIEFLESSPTERKELIQNLLIGSTRFFRDEEAWQFLETQVLPSLIKPLEEKEELRIWVAGCATGEEAYTIAMLVDEAIAESKKSVPVKIFATDLDTAALEIASQGVYAKNIREYVSPERLQKYFTEKSDGFAVKPYLRKLLIFAPQNLIKNAGFSQMKLIICRNVLIYMQTNLQVQVLRMLHFSLATQGILFLGSAEILATLEGEFISIHPKWKIYQKRRDIQLSLLPLAKSPILRPVMTTQFSKPRQDNFEHFLEEVFPFCLGDRRITCLLLDTENKLIHTFYDGAKLLQFPIGQPSLDITSIFPEPLQLPLTTALHRARREKKPVAYMGIKIHQENQLRTINLKVAFQQKNFKSEPFLMVLFEEEMASQISITADAFELDADTIQQIQELQYELQQTRENLQVTIEELETTNEEQQAANEEQIASNEELQSTNEELHSVNEELYTVNTEYQSKIQALTELNNDMDNLLQSTDIGVVFLDRELRIRKFTAAATKAINLLESDLQRPIAHLSYNFPCVELIGLLTQALETKETLNQDITIEGTGDHLLMRVHPYWSDRDRCDGLVLTFIDINKIKQAQAHLEYLYTSSPVGLCLTDKDLRFVQVNQVLANMSGLPVSDHMGKTVREVFPELANQIEPLFRQAIKTGEPIKNYPIQGTTAVEPDVQRYWIVSHYGLDLPEEHRLYGSAFSEVTELKQAEEKFRQSSEQLELITNALPAWISYVDELGCYRFSNATYEIWFGRSTQEIQGLYLLEVLGEEIYDQIQSYVQAVLGGESVSFDMEWSIPNLGKRWVQVCFIPHRLDDRPVQGFFALIGDINDRKTMEKIKDEFISVISHELRTPLTAIQGSLRLLSNQMVPLDSDKGRHLINMASENTLRLVTFINDVLDLQRLQSFKTRLEKTMVQATELMNQAVQQIQAITDAAEVSITVVPQDIEFYADHDRILRVMINLLNNAIKFSDRGSAINFVVEQTQDDRNSDAILPDNPPISAHSPWILFKVQDRGRGIPVDKITTIFESFYQVDSSDSRQKGGSGLGLAICRNIIEQHGGKIWVESQLNIGSTFYFTIPLIKNGQEKENETDE